MGLYDSYDAELQSEVAFGDGIVLTLLSDLHPKMQAVKARLGKKYRHNLNDASPEITAEIELAKVGVAVAGWRGVTGRDGAELPFSAENVRKVMTDLPWLRQDVLYAVLTKETFRKEAQAALGEASAPPSASS